MACNCRAKRLWGHKLAATVCMVTLIFLSLILPSSNLNLIQVVHAQAPPNSAAVAPGHFWGPFFGTSGDVQVDINRRGIAVRVEVPREFLDGVITSENDTHFVKSDIRNDYYYYSVVDEARHWTYDWNRTDSDGPCYKPNFSIYDPNAPWCVEIWNYLNETFLNFTAPKFVRFIGLKAPSVAGVYNFTLFVANQTNRLGLPDFVHAWNKTLFVPVSMIDNPATISGSICDDDDPLNLAPTNYCPPILAKGVIYARNINTGQLARAYVNQTTSQYRLTGLAPGDYEVQGSAGIFHGLAYSLSDPITVFGLQRGSSVSTVTLHLKRAPQICGTISYQNSTTSLPVLHSLTDHPYLKKIGFKVLNITVEATDPAGHVFRYQNVSLDSATDSFTMLTGAGIKYVGTDPYGTEFAGLPSIEHGSYQMTLNVWMTGYLQKSSEVVTISAAPGRNPPYLCNVPSPPVIMRTGGVISGTIQFWNLAIPETPHQAEVSLGLGTVTDALFGGNILIQAYDYTGLLRGVVVLNGTLPDGRTIYANSYSVRFYIIGFSEFYNRTWAGTWGVKDYGLPADAGYSLVVKVRGYEQATSPTVSLLEGTNSTTAVKMVRGGAILVTVTSNINRFGTRAIQAEKPFKFLNFSIPVRARVYFYASNGITVGYEERPLVEGVNGVKLSSFTIVFAGMNWSLREIWFYGYMPTHITDDVYSIKAYTLGYVQQRDISNNAGLAGLTRSGVPLLIANEIDLSSPIFQEPQLFGNIPEHDHSLAEAFSGSLVGAVNANLTAGTPSPLFFPIFGFGGMIQNSVFNGQGHFFYVAADGTRYFDYGLDVGTYTAQVPEFGFVRHFMQISPVPSVTFTDLYLQKEVFSNLIAMARITEGIPNNPVLGWVAGISVNETIPLSWVHVEAVNASFDRYVPTLDGLYEGVGSLDLPAGSYNITFSVANYKSQTAASFPVNWNGDYSLLPPLGPLCPTVGIPGVCDPPMTISQQSSSVPGAVLLTAEVNPRENLTPLNFTWSASNGKLNSSVGQSVLWFPENVNGSDTEITAKAFVMTNRGTALLSSNLTVKTQPIPEFNDSPSILLGSFTIAAVTITLVRKRRNRNHQVETWA